MTDETMRAELGDDAVDAAIWAVVDGFGTCDDDLQARALDRAIYCAAITAERTRCAAIARAAGREDIAAEIER